MSEEGEGTLDHTASTSTNHHTATTLEGLVRQQEVENPYRELSLFVSADCVIDHVSKLLPVSRHTTRLSFPGSNPKCSSLQTTWWPSNRMSMILTTGRGHFTLHSLTERL